MHRFIFAAVLGVAVPGMALADEKPWEPSKTGMIECFSPDLTKKTCLGMITYRWQDAENVAAEGRSYNARIAAGVVSISSWNAKITKDRNCFVPDQAFVERTRFEVDGNAVSEEKSAQYRREMTYAMKQTLGLVHCLRIGKYGREYTAQLTIDGFEMPSEANWIAWIGKDDGFTLSP